MINSFNLSGRTIVITGATGHLGKSMAQALEAYGAKLVIISRSHDKLKEIASLLKSEHLFLHGDLLDSKFIQNLTSILEASGVMSVEGVINNAYLGQTGSIEHIDENNFHDALKINMSAPFLLIKGLLPLLIKSDFDIKTIINIGSMYGIRSPNSSIYDNDKAFNPIHYGATKAGLMQMTRYLATHLANYGIRVNSISPGPFPDVTKCDKNFLDRLCEKVPMNRTGHPEELTGAVIFLSSNSCSYLTGEDLRIDGGWTVW